MILIQPCSASPHSCEGGRKATGARKNGSILDTNETRFLEEAASCDDRPGPAAHVGECGAQAGVGARFEDAENELQHILHGLRGPKISPAGGCVFMMEL